MRLSGLSIFAVVLASSLAFAQHHDAGSAPSAPPSPPAPVQSTPAPAPVSAPSPAPSAPSIPAPVATHSTMPSPAPAPSAPENRIAPAPTHVAPSAPTPPSAPNAPSTPRTGMTSEKTFSPSRAPGAERVVPDTKISGENRIASSPRIGEDPQKKKEDGAKLGDPELRRKICLDGPCRESQTSTGESDLRRHLCIDGHCNCSNGETATNKGCVPTQVLMDQNPPLACPAGQYSNGDVCVSSAAACASVNGQASSYATELRGLRSQMDQACQQNSSGQECADLRMHWRQKLLLYRSLWDGARTECRGRLADPASL
jgi:hypothetical protein